MAEQEDINVVEAAVEQEHANAEGMAVDQEDANVAEETTEQEDVETAEESTAHKSFTAVMKEKLLNIYLELPTHKLEEIRLHLERTGRYKNGRWSDFPIDGDNVYDKFLYRSFEGLGNAINDFVKAQHWDERDPIKGRWITCEMNYCTARPSISLPPSCAFVEEDTSEEFLDIWGEDGAIPEVFTVESMNARWAFVLNPVNIRCENTTKVWEEALLTLYDQAHHIFLTQKNRLSVIGLILCLDVLNVFIIDKHGVTGLSDPIKIHEDPASFIHVLAAFSLLSRRELGFARDTGKKKAEPSIYPFENFNIQVDKNPNVHIPKRSAKISNSRAIYRFNDIRELLVGFRDAIQAHKEAYEKGVLHANITKDSIRLEDETINIDFE